MLKIRLFPLLCLFVQVCLAQPVITTTDLLKVGDVVITQPCATTTFNPGSAGANQNWDFTTLLPEGTSDTTFYISPIGTPYAVNYPSSNIVASFNGNDYGYYQVTGDQLLYWGNQSPASALVLTNPAVYFISPMAYGTFLLDTIAGSLSSGPLNGSVTGQVFLEGDGYGTLTTPGGQYTNVLRVKTVTIGVAMVPFLGTITDSVFNYSWYKLGVKSPVLEMIEDTQWSNGAIVSQTRYVNFFQSITSKASEPKRTDAITIQAFPNPTDDQVQFAGLEKPAHIIIQNTAGQRVLETSIEPHEPLYVKSLHAGMYICSVYMENNSVQVIKLTINN